MNLDFSDDQKFLQNEARKFLEKEESIKRSREILDQSSSLDTDLWQKIVALGWTGIRIPENFDGLGLGHLELCVIAEELGRFLAPVPFSSSVYLFTEAVIKYGSEELKKDILPKLVSGEIVGTLAVAEDFMAPSSSNIKTEVLNNKISGKKIAVPDAGIATHSIVVCKSSNGIDLRLIDHKDKSLNILKQDTV
ncbi:acyl-CoA dehydrogenase family protein, partial [Gammaproteobacteria bacterium]|nr:acyl-CoA dehydrogenase family protein [Gammaproteobacteria bacterium]